MKARIFPILALACLSLSSCLSYDADEFTGRIMPRVASYTSGVTNDWIYFNLRTGEVFNRTAPNQEIKEGEQKNRLDWDIAFCGYHVRTNSGTSGNGKGGAIDLGYGDYDRWQHIDQLPKGQGWVVDDDKTVKITYSQSDWFRYVNTHGLDPKENPWFDPNNGPCQPPVGKKHVSLWSADDLHAVVPCLCSAYRRRKTLFQITDYQLV